MINVEIIEMYGNWIMYFGMISVIEDIGGKYIVLELNDNENIFVRIFRML